MIYVGIELISETLRKALAVIDNQPLSPEVEAQLQSDERLDIRIRQYLEEGWLLTCKRGEVAVITDVSSLAEGRRLLRQNRFESHEALGVILGKQSFFLCKRCGDFHSFEVLVKPNAFHHCANHQHPQEPGAAAHTLSKLIEDPSVGSDKLEKCHECGVEPGEFHLEGCCRERCVTTGHHAHWCKCPNHPIPFRERLRWMGEDELVTAARKYGWYARRSLKSGKTVRCKKSAQGAVPDARRAFHNSVWDVLRKQFVCVPEGTRSKPT